MTRQRKENPQKEISKEWIVNALLELMDKKPYTQITITEVSKHADLARRTFYRHFNTVDEVLEYHIQKMSKKLAIIFADGMKENKSFEEYVVMYFSFWENHKNFLHILRKNDLTSVLLFNFMPSVRNNLPANYSSDSYADYLFYFLFGGICNLLVKWLEDGAKLTSTEMGEVAKMVTSHWS